MEQLLAIGIESGGPDWERFSVLSVGLVVVHNGWLGACEEFYVAEPEIVIGPDAQRRSVFGPDTYKLIGFDPALAYRSISAFMDEHFADCDRVPVRLVGHGVARDFGFLSRLARLAGKGGFEQLDGRHIDTKRALGLLENGKRLPYGATRQEQVLERFGVGLDERLGGGAVRQARGVGQLLIEMRRHVGEMSSSGLAANACAGRVVG